jgi:hypothetical protein
MTNPEPATPAKLAYTQREFCEAVGIGMTSLHRYRRAGRLKTVALGGRTLITVEEARRFLQDEARPRATRGFKLGNGASKRKKRS